MLNNGSLPQMSDIQPRFYGGYPCCVGSVNRYGAGASVPASITKSTDGGSWTVCRSEWILVVTGSSSFAENDYPEQGAFRN